jgi:hypothetical protein
MKFGHQQNFLLIHRHREKIFSKNNEFKIQKTFCKPLNPFPSTNLNSIHSTHLSTHANEIVNKRRKCIPLKVKQMKQGLNKGLIKSILHMNFY